MPSSASCSPDGNCDLLEIGGRPEIAKLKERHRVEDALKHVTDEASFIHFTVHRLNRDVLELMSRKLRDGPKGTPLPASG